MLMATLKSWYINSNMTFSQAVYTAFSMMYGLYFVSLHFSQFLFVCRKLGILVIILYQFSVLVSPLLFFMLTC